MTSWLLTALYGVVEVAYAIGGSIVGGLAWVGAGGDSKVARSILGAVITGDSIIRLENLSGQKPIHFVGRNS
jgi:hypothetical protein